MQGMISRYRDRLINSSSQFKPLSASRQKPQQSKNKQQIYIAQNKQKQKQKQRNQQKLNNQQKQKQRLPPNPRQQNNVQLSKQRQKKLSQTNLKSSRKHPIISNSKSHQKLSKQTPKKPFIPTINALNQSYSQSIYQLLSQQKNIYLINKNDMKQKIKILINQYYNKRIQINDKHKNLAISTIVQNQLYSATNIDSNHNIINHQQLFHHNAMNSHNAINSHNAMNSSNILSSTSNRVFESQLQRRYLQCQKQRQYFKNKLDTMTKKYESLFKQVQKYSKIQKLINSTIQTQNQSRKQIIRLRKQLEVSELKSNQQQKIFRKQVSQIYEIIQQLKANIHNNQNINNTNNNNSTTHINNSNNNNNNNQSQNISKPSHINKKLNQ